MEKCCLRGYIFIGSVIFVCFQTVNIVFKLGNNVQASVFKRGKIICLGLCIFLKLNTLLVLKKCP